MTPSNNGSGQLMPQHSRREHQPAGSCLQGDGFLGQVGLGSPKLCAQQSHQKGHLGTLGSIWILLPERHSARSLSGPHAWGIHAGLPRRPVAGAALMQGLNKEAALMFPCTSTAMS